MGSILEIEGSVTTWEESGIIVSHQHACLVCGVRITQQKTREAPVSGSVFSRCFLVDLLVAQQEANLSLLCFSSEHSRHVERV